MVRLIYLTGNEKNTLNCSVYRKKDKCIKIYFEILNIRSHYKHLGKRVLKQIIHYKILKNLITEKINK